VNATEGVRERVERVPGAQPILAVCGMAFEAKLLEKKGVRAIWGLQPAHLEREFERALLAGCAGVVSFGTAGGLDPSLLPGSWVIAEAVVSAEERFACDLVWAERIAAHLGGARQGLIAATNAPILETRDKAALYEATGALAVDMESHRAARLAWRHQVPFVACRVVVDAAQRRLPSSAIVGLRRDGGLAIGRILAELARHPGQLFELIRLAGDAATARRALVLGLNALGARFTLPG